MSKDAMRDREQALENQFFEKRDREIIAAMRAEHTRETHLEALARASGVADPDLLLALLEEGVTAESLLALTVVPLVVVAWADRELAPAERFAILDQAHALGIERGQAPHSLLESWLEHPPSRRFQDAWAELVRLVCARLGAEDRVRLRDALLGPAEAVAEAAGGVLGVGPRVSKVERAALERMASAFDGADGEA